MFLADLLVVFAVTAVVVFLFGQARLPSVVGLLVDLDRRQAPVPLRTLRVHDGGRPDHRSAEP
jgi:hypothetical protein